MSKIQFYTHPMSRGQIARWALHEAGADYETHVVEYGDRMKGDAYLAINPMGKVPAIVHESRVVTEVAAICAYLAETFPAAGLAPEASERADYFRWLFFVAGPLEQALSLTHLGIAPTPEQQRTLGCGDPARVVDVLCAKLARDAFVCGERFTMADVYVGSHVDWGLAFGTLPELAPLQAYAERIRRRSAYQAAKAIDAALIAERNPG
ncbi:MAG: glutathione S-transferase family protein [Rhodocyclaceae bacterium]|nr:glutathione S-transferase family protein [Rhodocyclaceae bacterium]